jgi:two-component system, LuxR family, sensor kinase FixL
VDPSAPHNPEIATYLFEHARDILLVIDAETGQLIDANQAAELAYGYDRSTLLGLTIFQLRAADLEPVTSQMQRANTEGILFRTLHQRRDGTTFPVEVNSRGQTIAGRRMLLSVVRDTSERTRLEAERETLIATTQRALEQREEFLMIVSHELRSPVTSISLLLYRLGCLVERGESGPGLLNMAHDAMAELARLSTLITALLDAQQATGQIVLTRAKLNVAELLHEVAAGLRARAQLAGSPVTVDIPRVDGAWDRLRLHQVFTNLLVNALKYGRGRPINVFGAVDATHVEVSVRDQGIGIAAADADRIFEKFERAVPAAYGGLGLGLYITRQLVHAHGGTIALDSVPGTGTTFRVRLPLSPA